MPYDDGDGFSCHPPRAGSGRRGGRHRCTDYSWSRGGYRQGQWSSHDDDLSDSDGDSGSGSSWPGGSGQTTASADTIKPKKDV